MRKLEKQVTSPMIPDLKGKPVCGMDGNEDMHFVFVDADGNLSTRNTVYNSSTLSWEPMTQPLPAGIAAHVVVDSGAVQVKTSGGTLIDPATEATIAAVLAAMDQLAKYALSDADDNAATKYFGYLDVAGNWYIKQVDGGSGAVRYVAGASGYSTNWTNRASLSYGYFDAVF